MRFFFNEKKVIYEYVKNKFDNIFKFFSKIICVQISFNL